MICFYVLYHIPISEHLPNHRPILTIMCTYSVLEFLEVVDGEHATTATTVIVAVNLDASLKRRSDSRQPSISLVLTSNIWIQCSQFSLVVLYYPLRVLDLIFAFDVRCIETNIVQEMKRKTKLIVGNLRVSISRIVSYFICHITTIATVNAHLLCAAYVREDRLMDGPWRGVLPYLLYLPNIQSSISINYFD